MSTLPSGPVQRGAPTPQRDLNRPSEPSVADLRATMNREAPGVELSRPAGSPSKRGAQPPKATALGKPVWWRPHVTDQDRQILQFVGVWLLGAALALAAHGVYWAVTR